MQPTPKLRFVERLHPHNAHQIVRVLQQWWAIERAGQITPEGEWRDVPLEKE
jgi:hypothetical protein